MKMQVDPSETTVFLTEAPLNPKKNREKMVQTMLEDFQFQGCKIETQATLTLIAQGLNSGLVFDSGDGVSHCVPVCDSRLLINDVNRLDIAGYDITKYLIKLLVERGYNIYTTFDIDRVREMKELFCYISSDPQQEIENYGNTVAWNEGYKLPDGRWINIGPERFQAPEALFNPVLIGKNDIGIDEMLYETLKNSPEDYRRILSRNIVLSGGTTMIPGFCDRLTKELQARISTKNEKLKCKIIDPLNRKILVFLGAAVVATILEDHPDQWITKADWEENGPRAIDLN